MVSMASIAVAVGCYADKGGREERKSESTFYVVAVKVSPGSNDTDAFLSTTGDFFLSGWSEVVLK